MKIFFKVIIAIFFAIGSIILIIVYVKYFLRFKKFGDYLFQIDDKDTLRKIGRINSLGQRVFATVPFTKVHKVLLEKYEQTKDKEYLLFYEKYMRATKQAAILIASLFILYVIGQIIDEVCGT